MYLVLAINSRIRVWFEDREKYFLGTISEVHDDEHYSIVWDAKTEQSSRLELRAVNNTKDLTNSERWSVIATSIKKRKTNELRGLIAFEKV